MKFAIASSLPLLALLPATALGGIVEKRDAEAAPARVVQRAQTVTVQKTFTKTINHNARITTRVTVTKVAPTQTVTISQSTTSTVAAQSGFVAANAAITAQAHVRRDALLHKPSNLPEIKMITVHAKPKTITRNIGHTEFIKKVVATRTIHPTTTVYHAKATAYAACGPSNLLGFTFGSGSVSGGNSTGNGTSSDRIGINSVVLVAGSVPETSDTDTAYACCVKCQNTAGCVGSQWRSGVCSTHVRAASAGQCNVNAQDYVFGTFYADPGRALNAGTGLILSNGRCGSTWKYGGLKAS